MIKSTKQLKCALNNTLVSLKHLLPISQIAVKQKYLSHIMQLCQEKFM